LLVDLVGRSNDGFLLADGRLLAAGFLLDVAYRALMSAGDRAVTAYRFVQHDLGRAGFEVVPGPAFGTESERALI